MNRIIIQAIVLLIGGQICCSIFGTQIFENYGYVCGLCVGALSIAISRDLTKKGENDNERKK